MELDCRNPYGTLHDCDHNVKQWDEKIDCIVLELEDAFKKADEDCDGKIDYGEFRQAIKTVHKTHSPQTTEEDTMRLFRDADLDLDGKVDYEDFLRSFGGRFFCLYFIGPNPGLVLFLFLPLKSCSKHILFL